VVRKILPPLVRNALTFVLRSHSAHSDMGGDAGWFERLWIEDNGIGIDRSIGAGFSGCSSGCIGRMNIPDGYRAGDSFKRNGTLGRICGVESKPGEGSRFWLEFPGGRIRSRRWSART